MRCNQHVLVFVVLSVMVCRPLLSANSEPISHSPLSPPEARSKPTLFLIGDSTVKCGRGDGAGGMYGWGQVIGEHFDTNSITIDNRALGGRSSRTYLTEGQWQQVLDELTAGDYVLMQFGHNDGGEMFTGDRPRASIKGNGDETRDGIVEQTGRHESVHTYGWYLRKYIADIQQRGATPIVLSLVPRDIWEDGRVVRAAGDYGKWAREAAEGTGAAFIDLNELVARRYERDGRAIVHNEYFTPQDHTHTSLQGAKVNAECVVAGIRALADCPLRGYLMPQPAAIEAEPASVCRFDFGSGAVAADHKPVGSDCEYTVARGFGFEPDGRVHGRCNGDDPLMDDLCFSDRPFYFSVNVPEGNYLVRVTTPVGDSYSPSTIKAELRRLMIEQSTGHTHEFVVNVRQPTLGDGKRVRLKEREEKSESWAWDEKLTLEFNGPQPAVASLEVRPAPDCITVFLGGDSTVADQPLEPWNSWGQMLPRFFGPTVAVANHAESGESIKSSLAARRFDKIFQLAQPGDYLFLQFGHNDMKDQASGAFAAYRENLAGVIERSQRANVTPVLITSMERKNGIETDTLGAYPQIVRDLAKDLDVPLIDLHTASKRLYKDLGSDLDRAFVDGTHHTSYGSYLLAKCVVQGIQSQVPELATHLKDDLSPSETIRPVRWDAWDLPDSPKCDPELSARR